jgi:ferrochelatase
MSGGGNLGVLPDRIGVVLCNIGGPASADLLVVEHYLKTFFSDPAIIPVRAPLRWMIARGIARRRAPESAKNYAKIGGRSPILDWTETQRSALEARLNARRDGSRYRCVTAMRYSRPSTREALDTLDREGFRNIVALPLYPQYSSASTGSALGEVDRLLLEMNMDRGKNRLRKLGEARSFERHPAYLRALASRAREAMPQFRDPDSLHWLFSAHGLPQSLIDAGDPYQRQIESTVRGFLELWGSPVRHSIAYQNRVGPQKWLEPSTGAEIQRLGRAGTREILVIPVSFVSDHLETLHEIAIVCAGIAAKSGIEKFVCIRGLNESEEFSRALEELVIRAGKS